MERYQRLTRSQVIAGLRTHAAKHGFVSNVSLLAHDRVLLRSIPLHFVGISAAREAAGVGGPPYRKPRRKTGPKAGTVAGRRVRRWSRERVIDELRRLDREGQRTAHADLVRAGLLSLIAAARDYAGGLRRARAAAGIEAPPVRRATPSWNQRKVIDAILRRARGRRPLSSSMAPPDLVAAGRWHFGSWRVALEASGVDRAAARIERRKYTRDEIIKRLRRAVRSGVELRSSALAKVMKLEAVRREFGSLHAAIRAVGLGKELEQRKHGLQKWNRERVIEVLRERAARRVYTLTPGLHRVVQLYFGGADAARLAAGVPSPGDIRRPRLPSPEAQPRAMPKTSKRRSASRSSRRT